MDDHIDHMQHELNNLRDELAWRRDRQSEASRKGWQTRKSNAQQARQQRERQNEHDMRAAGLCQTRDTITARTRDGERNIDKPSDGVKHNPALRAAQ